MALLLAITCVLITQMSHASPFQTFNFQELSNNIRTILIQWVLTPVIVENSGIHWESNSQSGNSLGRVEVHSLALSHTPRRIKCDSQASLLARTFASPYLGHEPKIKVATLEHLNNTFIILIMKYSHNNLKEKM